jgi:hypothetical protein
VWDGAEEGRAASISIAQERVAAGGRFDGATPEPMTKRRR